MKVGTDGVLLGAWVDLSKADNILDIGTGTGLIALMLAQRCSASIDAIEIDEAAASQALENVRLSPWKMRVKVIHSSLQEFISPNKPYNLIVTNPPYFINALPAPDKKRALARHSQQLSLIELIKKAKSLMHPDGHFAVILPDSVYNEFVAQANLYNLYPVRETRVHSTPDKKAFRILAEFSLTEQEPERSELVIEENGRHNYSEDYYRLTNEFYLDM